MRAFSAYVGALVCMTLFSPHMSWAGEHQAEQIERLEQENRDLVFENNRLRSELRQRREMAGRREQLRRQGRRPLSYPPTGGLGWYGYGRRPLQETNQTLRDLEQAKRSLQNLGK